MVTRCRWLAVPPTSAISHHQFNLPSFLNAYEIPGFCFLAAPTLPLFSTLFVCVRLRLRLSRSLSCSIHLTLSVAAPPLPWFCSVVPGYTNQAIAVFDQEPPYS